MVIISFLHQPYRRKHAPYLIRGRYPGRPALTGFPFSRGMTSLFVILGRVQRVRRIRLPRLSLRGDPTDPSFPLPLSLNGRGTKGEGRSPVDVPARRSALRHAGVAISCIFCAIILFPITPGCRILNSHSLVKYLDTYHKVKNKYAVFKADLT